MKNDNMKNFETPENDDEEMTVTLDLDDGSKVTCAAVTILTISAPLRCCS